MSHSIDQRGRSEHGFTLVELLVVILIIGILAAIAIPSFLNQKGKAVDASAKELARTAQTAAATYSVDHNGSYLGMTTEELHAVEPTIQIGSGGNNSYLEKGSGVTNASTSGYEVTATSTNGDTFSISNTGGVVNRTCTVKAGNSNGGCPTGSW
jgi:type IV pilus assembly protein PilA